MFVPIEILLAKAEAPDRIEPPVLKTRVRNDNGVFLGSLTLNHECVPPDFFTNGLDEFFRILSNGAISSGTFKQHFERVEMVVHGPRRCAVAGILRFWS